MKHRLATQSATRVWAREIIEKAIADHVFGPVGCLKPADIRELRGVLHQICPLKDRSVWEVRIFREEFRAALGYQTTKPKMVRRLSLTESDILPSMREWARQKGIILPAQTQQP